MFTPDWLADLLAESLLEEPSDGVVLDPACGEGSLLLAVCRARVRRGWSPIDAVAAVEGWDRDPIAAATCRAALAAFGGVPRVCVGDALAPISPDGLPADRARFAAVITNPPYVEAKRFRTEPGLRERVLAWFPELTGAFDLYVPFLWRAMGLVTARGAVAALLPGKVLQARYASGLRRAWLAAPWHLRELVDLTRCLPRPFPGTSVYPCIVTVSRREGPLRTSRVRAPGVVSDRAHTPVEPLRAIGGESPLFVPFDTWPDLAPLFALPRLGSVGRFVSTCSFHRRGQRERYVTPTRPDDEEAFPYLGALSHTGRLELAPFRIQWTGGFIRASAWRDCPLPDRAAVFGRPKLILAQHATRPIVALDLAGRFVTKDTYPVGWSTDPRWSLPTLAAVLSSSVFTALYNTLFQGVLVGGETYHYLPAFLHQVPVPTSPPEVDDAVSRLCEGEGPLDEDAWVEVDRAVARAYGVEESARLRMALHKHEAPTSRARRGSGITRT